MSFCRNTAPALLSIAFAAACATPPLPPIATLPNDAPLIEGTNCREASPLAWTFDAQTRVAKLGETGIEARLPPSFVVSQERPELLVLGGNPYGSGPKTRFELMAAPKCDAVAPTSVLRRMAVRSLQHRYRVNEINAAFATATEQRKLRVTTPKPGAIIEDGDLLMRDAEVSLALFYTPVAEADPHQIVVAAGCPRNEDARRACEKTYRALIDSVKVVAPAPPAPSELTPTP